MDRIRQRLEKQFRELFGEQEGSSHLVTAMLMVYDHIVKLAQEFGEIAPYKYPSFEQSCILWQLAAIIRLTPIKFVGTILAEDELLPIRVAAKGLGCNTEKKGPEDVLYITAVITLMTSVSAERLPEIIHPVIFSKEIYAADEEWRKGANGRSMFPSMLFLVIR